jgi:hypothetical protein
MALDLKLRYCFLCLVVTVKQAYITGYVVLAATAVSTVVLTLIK